VLIRNGIIVIDELIGFHNPLANLLVLHGMAHEFVPKDIDSQSRHTLKPRLRSNEKKKLLKGIVSFL
jgi:hypothetical protein